MRSVYLPIRTNSCWDRPSLESLVFLGTVPYFGTKTCGTNGLEKTRRCAGDFLISPEYLTIAEANIPTNWDEEQNWHLSGDHWIEAGCILPSSEEQNCPHGDLQKAVGPRKMFHMSIVHSHSNELCSIPLGGNTSCWWRLSHTETWICGWGHIHHLHPRRSTVISCNISCPNRRNVWSRRQNGDAASAVSRNSLEAQGSPGNFTPEMADLIAKNGEFDQGRS